MDLSIARVRWFVEQYGGLLQKPGLEEKILKLCYYSTPRINERTSYLSELIDLTPIEYESVDVAPGLKTTILDLNFNHIPEYWIGTFDLVLNLGTTEHILNQWNSFEFMHDAARIGGHIFHQVPMSGWTEHGYFAYRPQFFLDIAQANSYDVVDMWINKAGQGRIDVSRIDARKGKRPGFIGSGLKGHKKFEIVDFNINVVLRKNSDASFRSGLETRTSHAAVDPVIESRYKFPE